MIWDRKSQVMPYIFVFGHLILSHTISMGWFMAPVIERIHDELHRSTLKTGPGYDNTLNDSIK